MPVAGDIDQVTLVFAAPVTCAVNCCDCNWFKLTLVGVTLTEAPEDVVFRRTNVPIIGAECTGGVGTVPEGAETALNVMGIDTGLPVKTPDAKGVAN